MISGPALAPALLQAIAALAAGYGAWRCIQLQRFAPDRRLMVLGWFFGLFAVALALLTAWTLGYSTPNREALTIIPFGNDPSNGTFPGFPRGAGAFEPRGDERVNLLLVGHHGLMLASLSVGVVAFGRRHPAEATAAAALGLVSFGELVPTMLALEAGLTLYLAARALINHVDRRTPGAVQVALGFLLFFMGHLLFFLNHRPGFARTGIGDVLGLVGIILLVQVLPGKR